MRKAEVLELKDGDRAELEKIVKIRIEQSPGLWRGLSLLLLKAGGETIDAIAGRLMASKACVRLCLKKYKEGGLKRALHDDQRSGHPASRRACPRFTRTRKRTQALKMPPARLPSGRQEAYAELMPCG